MKKSFYSTLFWTIVFLIFLASPFDLWLNINISGFNIRISQILILILDIAFVIEIITRRKFFILPSTGILWVWGWIMFLFSANSLLITRSVGYGIWLISLIIWVMYLSNRGYYFSETEKERLITLYTLSFLPSILFGLLQWIFPSLLISDSFPFKTQNYLTVFNYYHLHRINGFNYEPSYYATYLIVLLPLLWAWIKNENCNRRIFGIFFLVLSVLAITLSTSRMGWLGISLFVGGVLLIEIYWKLKRCFSGKENLMRIVILIVVINFCLIFTLIFVSGYKKIQKKLQDYFAASYYDRMEGYRNAFILFFRNPFKACGLGGVAPDIAFNEWGILPVDNAEAKNYEAANVLLEIISGGGIIGSVLFAGFWVTLFILLLKRYKTYSTEKRLLSIELLYGLFLQWFLLIFNQNILRIYVWNHIAVIMCFISFSGREEKNKGDFRFYRVLSAGIISLLSMIFVVLIFVFAPSSIKLHKLEVFLKNTRNIKSVYLNYYTAHNSFYKGNLQSFKISTIKPMKISNTFAFDILKKSQEVSDGTFYESEKGSVYKWISEQIISLSVQPEIWDYTTNFLSLLYKQDKKFFESRKKSLTTVNRILSNENLYYPLLLKKFSFSPEIQKYLKNKNLSRDEMINLNRRILEEIYTDVYTYIPSNPLNHRAYNIELAFVLNTNFLQNLKNVQETMSIQEYIPFDHAVFETDSGKIKLSREDIYSYFKFLYGGDQYTSLSRSESDSTNPTIFLDFKNAPLDFFLWYFQKRYIYLAVMIITGISTFLISLLLLKRKES